MAHAYVEDRERRYSNETDGVMPGSVATDVSGNGIVGSDHVDSPHGYRDRGFTGGHHLEDDLKHLGIKSAVTGEGPPFCLPPNQIASLPKEYETRVQVIQKYPEMKNVEETYFVKEVRNETRTVMVPRTRVIKEEHERIDMVPVIKQVPKTRIEIVYRVVEEEREVTDMIPVVEMVPVPRIEQIPKLITEEFEETVEIPTVVEVPMVRTIQVPTGRFCEMEAGTYVNPTHFNLLGKKSHGKLRKNGSGSSKSSSSSSSSSSSDDEHHHGNTTPSRNWGQTNSSPGRNLGQTNSSPSKPKKKTLLKRIEEKIVG
ncbi:hypothetical protein R1sor_001151 [Riccia sorocarpa]|uniref:Uncharacterized protein n=1 Tax=Riccia sorocarpa TaxID=122646 RepID=A0ABD3GXQ2_9MARC